MALRFHQISMPHPMLPGIRGLRLHTLMKCGEIRNRQQNARSDLSWCCSRKARDFGTSDLWPQPAQGDKVHLFLSRNPLGCRSARIPLLAFVRAELTKYNS